MAVLFVVLTVLAVAVIGLVAVGGVTARLAAAPPATVFDLDEAVTFVADRLPAHAAGLVTYDELRQLLGWHLDYLEAEGLAAPDDGAGREGAVAGDDEGVAWVLGRAADAGVEVDDVAVAMVIESAADYLSAIGALGHEVAPPARENGG